MFLTKVLNSSSVYRSLSFNIRNLPFNCLYRASIYYTITLSSYFPFLYFHFPYRSFRLPFFLLVIHFSQPPLPPFLPTAAAGNGVEHFFLQPFLPFRPTSVGLGFCERFPLLSSRLPALSNYATVEFLPILSLARFLLPVVWSVIVGPDTGREAHGGGGNNCNPFFVWEIFSVKVFLTSVFFFSFFPLALRYYGEFL